MIFSSLLVYLLYRLIIHQNKNEDLRYEGGAFVERFTLLELQADSASASPNSPESPKMRLKLSLNASWVIPKRLEEARKKNRADFIVDIEKNPGVANEVLF